MNHRAYRLSLSVFLFLAALALFLLNLKKAHFSYPLLALPLFFLKKSDYETKFIFILLASLLALLIPKFSDLGGNPVIYLVAAVELFSLWGFAYITREYEERERAASEAVESEISRNLYELKNIQNDSSAYKRHGERVLSKLELRKNFSGAIREFQKKQDIDEIKKDLLGAMRIYFKDSSVAIKSEIAGDSAAALVYESGMPLFVKNSDSDPRFKKGFFGPGEKSVIALPLSVFGNIAGLMKINSETGNKFNEEDLRSAEILSTIACINIENLSLFKKINELAVKDALTGLFTHRAFQEKLDEEILSSARTKMPFSLVIADIDHFKKYNDAYGHQAGDEVLRTVAGLFSKSVREIDFTARYGGEEFAFILPGINKHQAFAFAENLRLSLANLKFAFGGSGTPVSASFGITEFPGEATSKSQLIRTADERLYRAKKNGRNNCVYE